MCEDYIGRKNIQCHIQRLMEDYSTDDTNMSLFIEEDVPLSFIELVVCCAEYFKNHQVDAINRNVELATKKDDESYIKLNQLVCSFFMEKNPIQRLKYKDAILKNGIQWDNNIHPKLHKLSKWSGSFYKFDVESQLTYVSNQLQLCENELCCTNGAVMSVESDPYALNICVSRGLPFKHIGMSRFCYDQCLLIYIAYVSLREKFTLPGNELEQSESVVHIVPGPNEAVTPSHHDEQTYKLVTFLKSSYPHSEILVQHFPDHRNQPPAHCKALESLFTLLEEESLRQGCTVLLVNCPLLTRLQNGLFVALSSCFDTIEMKEHNVALLLGGAECSVPILTLKRLDLDRAELAVQKLRESGWRPLGTDAIGLSATQSIEDTTLNAFAISMDEVQSSTWLHEEPRGATTANGATDVNGASAANGATVVPNENSSETRKCIIDNSTKADAILEVFDTFDLINSNTHALVCKYNILLLIAWSKIVSSLVTVERRK